MIVQGLNTLSHVSIYVVNFRMKSSPENKPSPSSCPAGVGVLSGQLHLAASCQTVRRTLELQTGAAPSLFLRGSGLQSLHLHDNPLFTELFPEPVLSFRIIGLASE